MVVDSARRQRELRRDAAIRKTPGNQRDDLPLSFRQGPICMSGARRDESMAPQQRFSLFGLGQAQRSRLHSEEFVTGTVSQLRATLREERAPELQPRPRCIDRSAEFRKCARRSPTTAGSRPPTGPQQRQARPRLPGWLRGT